MIILSWVKRKRITPPDGRARKLQASPSLDLGVTTALIGNCGFTLAPCKPEHRDINMQNLTKVEGMPYKTLKEGIDWSYITYNEYLNLLEKKNLALNICSYIGHSAIRIWCMGEASMEREANENEIKEKLSHLPFVKNNYLDIDIIEVKPYRGFM